jgi:hypothetical protein
MSATQLIQYTGDVSVLLSSYIEQVLVCYSAHKQVTDKGAAHIEVPVSACYSPHIILRCDVSATQLM